jgi:HK97 family phage portal protein
MGMFDKLRDVFRPKTADKSSNTLFGQTQLGNQIVRTQQDGQQGAAFQLLYVTTSSATNAGRVVDMSVLSRNSTIMSCVGVKARALAQCSIEIMYKTDDGTFKNVFQSDAGPRDKAKAKQVLNLLQQPNNFQNQYEFWYQWCMWQDLAGESFTLLYRNNQKDAMQTPIEMYNLDATLITVQMTDLRYPSYRLSTPTYGFNRDQPLLAHQVVHCTEAAWQGSAGFNKGILATELVALDTDIDLYANYVMQNGAKPSGLFRTEQVIPDAKYKEIAARLKEAWASMTGSKTTDLSKPGQAIMLDQGMTFETVKMLTLQDADAARLKEQTTNRICALFGVPPQMLGLATGKYNNTQTLLDEFYKTTMYPMIINIEQKFRMGLLKGYPNLYIRFDTKDFLKGAALDQMNFVNAGVAGGIMTPNEAREYLNMPKVDGGDELLSTNTQAISQTNVPVGAKTAKIEPLPGSSPQDTGGGGGNQKRKANIGKT